MVLSLTEANGEKAANPFSVLVYCIAALKKSRPLSKAGLFLMSQKQFQPAASPLQPALAQRVRQRQATNKYRKQAAITSSSAANPRYGCLQGL